MKKIGIALGGGGPKGLAHIGVIKALTENKIPIDYISGTSAGALVGGLFSYLGSISDVELIIESLSLNSLSRFFYDLGFPGGLMGSEKELSFLDQILKDQTFETLKTKFVAVSTNLANGETIKIETGNMASGIHASCAIPGLFAPVPLMDNYLIDGGVSSPVPVKVAHEMGAEIVIASNLCTYKFPKFNQYDEKRPTKSVVGLSAVNMLMFNLAKKECVDADVVITPNVDFVTAEDIIKPQDRKHIIQIGYQETLKKMPLIENILKD